MHRGFVCPFFKKFFVPTPHRLKQQEHHQADNDDSRADSSDSKNEPSSVCISSVLDERTCAQLCDSSLQPRPTKGKMRIHCLENVDKALCFLYEQRVHLENMGAHDIVDGTPRLTLGLIWTIILRFQIQVRP